MKNFDNGSQQNSAFANMPSLVRLTHILYALQAISFFFGVTCLIALVGVIIAYVKLPDVAGTWLHSHFRWQIRTFWFGLLFIIIGGLTAIILIGWLILLATYIWLLYRVIKGWIYLNDGKEVY